MYANFKLPKLIFEGEDRYFLWKLGSKIAIFLQILTKIDNFEGSNIPEKSKFKKLLSDIFRSPQYISAKPKLALLES